MSSSSKDPTPSVCPVDHNARAAWLEAAAQESRRQPPHQPPNSRSVLLTPSPTPPTEEPDSACPVDHTARAAWLGAVAQQHRTSAPPSTSPFAPLAPSPPTQDNPPLGHHRTVSSIPRSPLSPSTTTPRPTSLPSPPTSLPSENWIYPSEHQFFTALLRKHHSPPPALIPTIVPLHNAVNERAWSLIRGWETTNSRLRALNAPCGGPKLRSFSGDAGKLTPRARMLGWLGYERPFDRHDWVVERCDGGGEMEYVIDFYRGRRKEVGGEREGKRVSFYLDVRPKLNSWEGVRMRVGRWFGLY